MRPPPEGLRLTGLFVVVEAQLSDGTRVRLHEEQHPATCWRCGQSLDSGGHIHGRMTMNAAGRLGFICLRH